MRATLAQEDWSSPRTTRNNFPESRGIQARWPSLEPPSEQLELEIYTPLTFCDSSEKSLLDADVDVEMSFDLDSESESDSDSDTSDDGDIDGLGVNESILDVSFSQPSPDAALTSTADDPSTDFAPISAAPLLPPSILLPSLPPIWPPRLPRLSTIPVYSLREYPRMELLGTPSRNSPSARGVLRHNKSTCSPMPVRSSDRMSVVL